MTEITIDELKELNDLVTAYTKAVNVIKKDIFTLSKEVIEDGMFALANDWSDLDPKDINETVKKQDIALAKIEVYEKILIILTGSSSII